jgi:hypothetical protein
MRVYAVCLAAALVSAQLLWAVHEAEALGHKPGEVCDLCLSLANVNHALIDDPAPMLVHARPALNGAPAVRRSLAALVRDLRARSPPSPSRLIPLV